MAAPGFAAGGSSSYGRSATQPGIQAAIGALKARLGGGRMPGGQSPPIIAMPPNGRGDPTPMPFPKPGGIPGGPVQQWGGHVVDPSSPGTLGPGVFGGAPPPPQPPQGSSQFDRDAAATGQWRGAQRFAGGTPDGVQPTPGAGGPLAGGPPPGGPIAAGGMQAVTPDLGINQAPPSPLLQAALAKQQQLSGGYGALLRGALQPQMAG